MEKNKEENISLCVKSWFKISFFLYSQFKALSGSGFFVIQSQ